MSIEFNNVDKLFTSMNFVKEKSSIFLKEFVNLFKDISLEEQKEFFDRLDNNDIVFFYHNLYSLVKENVNLEYCSNKFILYCLSNDEVIDLSKVSNKIIMDNINNILDILKKRDIDLIDDIIDILVNNNYIVSNNTHPLLLSNYKFISKIIENGQYSAINYADKNIVDDLLIIKSRFNYYNDFARVSKLKKSIEKSVENGQLVDSLKGLDYDLITLALLSRLSYKRIVNLNSNLINSIMNYDTVYKALSYGVSDSIDEYYKFIKDNNLNNDIDDKLIRTAIDNGYELSTDSSDIIISNYDYIRKIIELGNYNALTMFDMFISKHPELVKRGIDKDLVLLAISKGYFIYNNYSTNIIIKYCPEKLLEIIKDKSNFLSYLDDDMIDTLRNSDIDYIKLFLDSIDNFKHIYLSANIIELYYDYLVSRGCIDYIIEQVDDVFLKDNLVIKNKLMDSILMGKVRFEKVRHSTLLKEVIFKSYFSFFENVKDDEISEYIDNLIYLYGNRNIHLYHNNSKFDINKFKILLYDKDIVDKTNGLINVDEILFYTFSDRVEIDILNDIIDKGKLDELLNQFVYIINNFYHESDKIDIYNIFIKCIYNFSLNNKFIDKIISTHYENKQGYENGFVSIDEYQNMNDLDMLLLESNDYDLIKNFDSNNFTYGKYLDFIFSNCNIFDIYDIKNFIIMNLFNITVGKYNYIVQNKLNFKILNEIIETTNDISLKNKAQEFLILFTMIDEILDIDNLDDLQNLYNVLKDDMYSRNKTVLNVRSLTRNLESYINELYAYEANSKLVDLNSYPKVIDNNVEYIDLSDKKYTLYAHVYDGDNILDMFSTKKKGRFAICVSPITNLNNNTYDVGITFGYSNIPIKSYIGSSVKNMGSNFFIDENSINFSKEQLNYNFLTIRNSANYSDSFAETLLVREGLVPSCLITKELPIDNNIINAQDELKRNGIDIPIVYIGNSINKVQIEEESDINNNYQSNIDSLIELKKQLLDITDDKKIKFIEEEKIFKSSHNIYTGIYNGENYLIKPGVSKSGNIEPYRSYALLVGANVQSLVYSIASKYDNGINYNGAIPVYVEDIDGKDINMNEEKVTCALCKIIYDTINLEKINDIHNKKIVTGLMIEFIVDHLIFNYDSKIDNFIIDSYFNVYGIDKEQAFKYYKKCINNTEFLVDERFFDTSLVYNDILNDIDDDIICLLKNIVCEISNINDDDYIKLFIPYIDSYCSNYPDEREMLISAIIKRKNNLVYDLEEFINLKVVKTL